MGIDPLRQNADDQKKKQQPDRNGTETGCQAGKNSN
jgi:hypothetical protein